MRITGFLTLSEGYNQGRFQEICGLSQQRPLYSLLTDVLI